MLELGVDALWLASGLALHAEEVSAFFPAERRVDRAADVRQLWIDLPASYLDARIVQLLTQACSAAVKPFYRIAGIKRTMPRRGLGEAEQLLLFALVSLQERAHGVEVRELIEKQTGKSFSPGAIHTGYERLQRRGFVESQLGDPTPIRGGRRKRFYRITKAGAEALRDSYRRLTRIAAGRIPDLERLAGSSE